MFARQIKKSIFSINILILVLIIALTAVFGFGIVEPIDVATADDTSTEHNNEESPQSLSNEPVQSINFKKDWSIRDALQFLAAEYHKNIVPSPKVDGTVTVAQLYDVTFAEAMSAVLGNQFKAVAKGNFINVYTIEEYEAIRGDKGRMVYRTFILSYIAAVEVKKLSAALLSENGSIEATSPAEIGVPTNDGVTAGTGGDSIAMRDAVVVYDYPENVDRVENLITSLDRRPRQVLLEATILSVTLTEDTQMGFDWQSLKGTAVTALAGISPGSPDYLKSTNINQVDKTGGMVIGFAISDIAGFIRAVEQVTDVTVLANPKILAINKQLGQIYIGTRLGYREGDTINAGNIVTEGQVKFLDTGTKLSFRPYIGDDGYIRMDIHPKDSSGTLSAEGIPDETSAELVTNIMVKDGQTIVIGGLLRDKITVAKTQVPVIGDLPVIGSLFRGNADKNERQEVMILLTPHIINEPEETEGQGRSDDVERVYLGSKDALQWTTRSRLAGDRYTKAVEYYLNGNNKLAMRELDWALNIHPKSTEALSLRERILKEINAEPAERELLDAIGDKDSRKWRRR